ncbi:hypothetical protein DYQ86_15715 [Acidobacteria bacterium AB60]|nr:hypothetical protein DYQ86_15715 [Acidobacteria bacterium AB60]
MRLTLRWLAVSFLALLAIVPVIHGQATGLYAFGPFDSPGLDSINRGNLNIHLTIPVFSKPGRGSSSFYYYLNYDGLVWQPTDSAGDTVWTPAAEWGWTDVTNVEFGYVTYSLTINDCTKNGLQLQNQTFAQFLYHDAKGNAHGIPYSYTSPCGNMGAPSGTGTYALTDNSGYTIYRNGIAFSAMSRSGALFAVPHYPVGTTYQNHPGAASAQDTNGNVISASSSGVFTDTMGTTALSVSGVAPNPVIYTYTDPNGTHQTITVNYTQYTVQTAFGVSGTTEFSQAGVPLVSSIVYSADGSSYSFSYEQTPGNTSAVTGRIHSVTLRTGGTITYAYSGGYNGIEPDGTTANLMRTTSDGSATYTRSNISSTQSTTSFSDPSGNTTVSSYLLTSTGYFYETDRKSYAGVPSGTPLSEISTCYNTPQGSCSGNSVSSAFASILQTFYLNGSSPGFEYQTFAGPELVQSDLDSSTALTTYYDYNAYTGPYGITFYRAADSYSSSGSTLTAKTVYSYDDTTLTTTSGLPQHVSVSTTRGNLTHVQQWLNSTGSASVTTAYGYDDAGQVRSKTDPNGSVMNYNYDSTDALLTGITYPTVNGIQLTQGIQPDSNTGLPLSTTDPNLNVTHYHYDGLLRTTEVDDPDGGWTTIAYPNTYQISTYAFQNSSTHTDSEALYDGYGRLIRTALANGQSTNPWYQQDTCYDQNGRVSFTSYRYQGSGWGIGAVCSGTAGDGYTYDAIGRLTKVQHGDSTSAQASYNAATTQTTDESNVTRLTTRNLHGMVTGVCEISSNGTMPGSGAPAACNMDISGTGFKTTYAYSFLNHSVTVTQGAQSRFFQSDWIGRPILTTEPESGSTSYSYSYLTAGLQVARIRPKANQPNSSTTTTTTSQYDLLGRISSITYSDGTPAKTYTYDTGSLWGTTLQNPKGHLVQQFSGTNAGSIYNYDSMGRVTWNGECTPWTCGTGSHLVSYAYDWTGNLTQESDPASGTITYTRSLAGEVTSVVNQSYSLTGGAGPISLVSNVQYSANGPTSYSLGNGLKGVSSYDQLGRVQGNWVCSGSTSPSCSGGTKIYGNTMNWQGVRLTSSTEFDPMVNQSSTYSYDEFNRLTSKTGTAPNFSWVYDRWGNRWDQNVTAGTGPSPQLTINTANNQITGSGYTYDAAGNMTNDGSHSYTFDAEGNVTAVDGGATASAVYDGLNHKVRAQTGSNVVEFMFDITGRVTSNWVSATVANEGHIFADGAQVAFRSADGNTYFTQKDMVGTDRIHTGPSGAVNATYSSLPFGDGGAVSNNNNYAAWDFDRFGDMDFNTESNTYHAPFRQYAQTPGRWMSPDPYGGSYDFMNPQSMNRYSYSLNSPASLSDPSGLHVWCGNNIACTFHYNGSLSGGSSGAPGGDPYGPFETLLSSESDQRLLGLLGYQIIGGELYLAAGVVNVPNPDYGPNDPLLFTSFQNWVDLGLFSVAASNSNEEMYQLTGDQSGYYFKGWRHDVKSCFVDTGLGTIGDDMDPFAPGVWNIAGSVPAAVSQSNVLAAGAYIAQRGLTIPLRSSAVRSAFSGPELPGGALVGAEMLGKISGWVTIANLYYSIGDAYKNEWKKCGWK